MRRQGRVRGFVTMKTTGDKILDRTLDKVGGKGLFVKELDRRARPQVKSTSTVHSLKWCRWSAGRSAAHRVPKAGGRERRARAAGER